MINAKIVNVVATAALDQFINLAEIGKFKDIIHSDHKNISN